MMRSFFVIVGVEIAALAVVNMVWPVVQVATG